MSECARERVSERKCRRARARERERENAHVSSTVEYNRNRRIVMSVRRKRNDFDAVCREQSKCPLQEQAQAQAQRQRQRQRQAQTQTQAQAQSQNKPDGDRQSRRGTHRCAALPAIFFALAELRAYPCGTRRQKPREVTDVIECRLEADSAKNTVDLHRLRTRCVN